MALQTTLVFCLPSWCRVRWVINKTWGFMGNSRKFAQNLNYWDILQCETANSLYLILMFLISNSSPHPVNIWLPRSDCRVLQTDRLPFSSVLFWCAYGPTLPTPLTLHGNHLCDLMCNRLLGISSRCWMLLLWCIFFMHNIIIFSTNSMKDDGLCNNVKL